LHLVGPNGLIFPPHWHGYARGQRIHKLIALHYSSVA
jgi:hypothetical protein